MKNIDVLYLIEHTAREMDVACLVKAHLERDHGLSVEIRNMYLHARDNLREFNPKLVAYPFFYFAQGALATEDYVAAWPDAVHFNVAWEQLHYKAHWQIKRPADEFTRNNVVHHAWGDFYRDYLLEFGTDPDNIIVNGHPAYKLYHEPYRNRYCTREYLAAKYGLDPEKRWVFVPENYRWAFVGNKVDFFAKLGGDANEIEELRLFSRKSLAKLLRACNGLAKKSGVEVIFRTRPAIDTTVMLDFFFEKVGPAVPELKFIKKESVREWILASDMVVSSYSTSLLEAAVAGKPAYMFVPLPIPESLHLHWYDIAPQLTSIGEMLQTCTAGLSQEGQKPLRDWAEKNMLSTADPIRGLAGHISRLAGKCGEQKPTSVGEPVRKEYFNEMTHESDAFSPDQINTWTAEWAAVLDGERFSEGPTAPDEAINKSMNRDDLLDPRSKPVIEKLNSLIQDMYQSGVYMSSWVGTVPPDTGKLVAPSGKGMLKSLFSRHKPVKTHPEEEAALIRGMEQRLDYVPLPNAADDARLPWFLYWEICWVMRQMSDRLKPGARVLDAGGSGSLFSCFLGSQDYEVHAVDLNPKLEKLGGNIQRKMGYNATSYTMDLQQLTFEDEFFDHAFSICVFEHLDISIKRRALQEIARCLKPGGIFAITFDYRTPAPGVAGYGKDPRPRNQLKNIADIHRNFLSNSRFELIGNYDFYDNGKSYLVHPRFDNTPYTFGAVFLKKVN